MKNIILAILILVLPLYLLVGYLFFSKYTSTKDKSIKNVCSKELILQLKIQLLTPRNSLADILKIVKSPCVPNDISSLVDCEISNNQKIRALQIQQEQMYPPRDKRTSVEELKIERERSDFFATRPPCTDDHKEKTDKSNNKDYMDKIHDFLLSPIN